MVLVEHYGGEVKDMYMGPTSSYETINESSNVIPKGRYQIDHNTLWFIANGMQRQARPGGPRPYKGGPNQIAPPGPCYDCGGNHWIRDCPNPRKERKSSFELAKDHSVI